jgi:hypothetical protein
VGFTKSDEKVSNEKLLYARKKFKYGGGQPIGDDHAPLSHPILMYVYVSFPIVSSNHPMNHFFVQPVYPVSDDFVCCFLWKSQMVK